MPHVTRRKTMDISKKQKKIKKEDVRELCIDNAVWLVGCFFYAVAINIFNVPNQIAQGGFSGLAIVVNYLTGLPVGAVNFALNIPLFVLSWFFVGKRFVLRSLWVTGMLSVMIDVIAKFSAPFAYTNNPLLAAIFGGACSGIGVALVLYRGATSGGTDVLGRLLRLLAPHISYGRVIMAADITVVVIAAIVFRNVESAMYAAIVIFVSYKAIDFILYGFNKSKMLMVITEHSEEIAKTLTAASPRGISMVPVVGGYTGKEKMMLVCVVHGNEVSRVLKTVRRIDPNTFTIITEANEIIGKGFRASYNE